MKLDFNIQAIFPQPLYSSLMDRALTKNELTSARQYLKQSYGNEGNRTSAIMTVLDKSEFAEIRSWIQANLDNYLSRIYNPKNNLRLEITQSWLNLNRPGDYHHTHTHPNSWVSGVFYLETHGKNDTIKFEKNYSPWNIETDNGTPFTVESLYLSVAPAQLVLFPSSLIHSVPRNQTGKERVSLSFNSMLKGIISTSTGCALTL